MDGSKKRVRLPEERLHWPCREEDLINVIEVGEIGVDFDHPVWLDQQDRDDISL